VSENDNRDPGYVYFISEAPPQAGTTQEHFLGGLFGRPKEAVQQDWRDVIGKASEIISAKVNLPDDFTLDEIDFQLGFSAQGQLAFIAQAGVTASVTIMFKRKDAAGDAGH